MMKVSGIGVTSVLMRQISNTQSQMGDLQTQLASGKKADSYGGLGTDATMSLSLRREMSSLEGYRDNITMANTRIDVISTAVGAMRDHATSTRADLLVGGFEVIDDGQTLAQEQAQARLADTVELLNTEIAGRSLFGGTKSDSQPVAPPDHLLDGVDGKAGFTQIMDERMQADLGADKKGRLDQSVSGSTVSLAEDAGGSPFGFKLEAVNSSLTGATITGPAGDPSALDVQFSASLPQKGDSISITMGMPDGTTMQMTLTASDSNDPDEGTFAIGADADTTAASFNNALDTMIKHEAVTDLKAASMQAAADDFFSSGTNVAQRVDGPPFDSATGLKDATDTDTVSWYNGEKADSSARESMLARVDENQVVAYGARADEEAFTELVKQFAVLSSAKFDATDTTAYEEYTAFTDKVMEGLGESVGKQSLDRVVGEMAIATTTLGQADDRHKVTDNLLTGYLSEIESTNTEEAAAKILSLQTQLQASYQVTSMLSDLSLAKYL